MQLSTFVEEAVRRRQGLFRARSGNGSDQRQLQNEPRVRQPEAGRKRQFPKRNIKSVLSRKSHISCCVLQTQMPGGFPMMPGFPGMGNDPSAALGPFAQFLNNPAIMNMVSILQSPMTQISSHMFFQIIHYCFVRIASFRLLK